MKLAHSHGVLVYLALNIPIKQKELQHALEIADCAYAAGIDAVILQDLGLLRLLNEIYPDLELHGFFEPVLFGHIWKVYPEYACLS